MIVVVWCKRENMLVNFSWSEWKQQRNAFVMLEKCRAALAPCEIQRQLAGISMFPVQRFSVFDSAHNPRIHRLLPSLDKWVWLSSYIFHRTTADSSVSKTWELDFPKHSLCPSSRYRWIPHLRRALLHRTPTCHSDCSCGGWFVKYSVSPRPCPVVTHEKQEFMRHLPKKYNQIQTSNFTPWKKWIWDSPEGKQEWQHR